MPTTRPEKGQATQPVQSGEYQPLGAPTNPDALYGGNADDNSGSGGNAGPANNDGTSHSTPQPAETDADGNAQTDEQRASAIAGPGASGGSGTSIGQVTL